MREYPTRTLMKMETENMVLLSGFKSFWWVKQKVQNMELNALLVFMDTDSG